MSYLVLARKYRPRSFAEMVGQQHVVQALSNALTQQRLHHAYLFTGTRGVGKTTVSRILAKSLNCTGLDGQGGITAQPCGECNACRDIDAGRFVDYVELDAASNRGVEEITQLLDQAVYKPVLGRFKVYMVDEVHMLSNHAFNAMLKTLEEPPEYLKFVLATTDPQKVPPTVLSRCLQFNLRPMAMATMQDHLSSVLQAEQIDAEPGALRLLARAARGSMRDALSLADQAIAFGAGALSESGIRQMLGAVDSSQAVRLLDALAAADGAGLLAIVDDLRAQGLSAPGTLEEMAELLQRMAVAQAVPSAAADAQEAEATRLVGHFAPDHTALLYSMSLHGRAELALAPDEYGGLVMVLLRMLAFRPTREPLAAATSQPTGSSFSPAPAPAAARPAVPLQVPQSARAAVPLGPARGAARQPPARRAEVAATARPAATGREEADAPQGRADPQDDAAPPAWVDAPETDALAPSDNRPVTAAIAAPGAADRPPRSAGDDITPASVNAASGAGARLQPTELGARWAAAVEALIARGSVTALVRELAWQAQCVSIVEADPVQDRPTVWRLRVEREMLRAPPHCERLQNALVDWLGVPLKLETEAGRTDDTPALRALAERDRRQREAEEIIAHDPVVQSLLTQYRTARIVPGSVQPG